MIITRISKPYEINWYDFDITSIKDKNISNLIIDCPKIDNPQMDAEKFKELSKLNNFDDLIIKSSDVKVLEYFAFALKDISKKDKVIVIYEGKNEESIEEHIANCKNSGSKVGIPLELVMWISSKTLENVDELYVENNTDITRFDRLLKEVKAKEVREKLDFIISELLEKAQKAGVQLTELDKVVYVSNYIQSHFQFCEGIISSVKDKKFEVKKEEFSKRNLAPLSNGDVADAADFNNLLKNGFGHCQSFSKLTMLLLNNPKMNVDCKVSRTGGNGHVFNLLTIDGKRYVIDNTWCITRSPHRHKSYLRSKAFSDCFLLVGEKTIKGVSHHNHERDGALEDSDFPRDEIQKSVEKLKSLGIIFEYGDSKPRIPQELIKEVEVQ